METDAADRDESTHVVLDVQVAASFEQDTHNLDVAFVGSQVQGASAILWTQNTHNSAQGTTRQSAHNISTHSRQIQVKRKPTSAVPLTEPESSESDVSAEEVTVVIAGGRTEDSLLQNTIPLSNEPTENNLIHGLRE